MNLDTDEIRTCRDCGVAFTLTGGEQRFFADLGFPLPFRCQPCRRRRRRELPAPKLDDRGPQVLARPAGAATRQGDDDTRRHRGLR